MYEYDGRGEKRNGIVEMAYSTIWVYVGISLAE